jgi:hypothetical protein
MSFKPLSYSEYKKQQDLEDQEDLDEQKKIKESGTENLWNSLISFFGVKDSFADDTVGVSSCLKDEDCMNLDSYSSSGENLVYACPGSTCTKGTCVCGSNCKFDKYSGSCCQGLEEINGEQYCIENITRPKPFDMTAGPESLYSFEKFNAGRRPA